MAETERFAPFIDERGTLVPIEFDDVPFTVRRVFTVTAPGHSALRGDHANAMNALMVLVSGACDVRLSMSADGDSVDHELRGPGEAVLVEAGSFIRYELLTGDTTVLVLCDRPYPQSRLTTTPEKDEAQWSPEH